MRLLQANKILLGACVVVVPLSLYAGIRLKDNYLDKEFARTNKEPSPHERARRARVVQLQEERVKLLEEGESLDAKIAEIRERMAGRT